jgi:hypothetical protein
MNQRKRLSRKRACLALSPELLLREMEGAGAEFIFTTTGRSLLIRNLAQLPPALLAQLMASDQRALVTAVRQRAAPCPVEVQP